MGHAGRRRGRGAEDRGASKADGLSRSETAASGGKETRGERERDCGKPARRSEKREGSVIESTRYWQTVSQQIIGNANGTSLPVIVR